jgi:hypothetical protein
MGACRRPRIGVTLSRLWKLYLCALGLCAVATAAHAQNRGVYPLGMTSLSSGLTPGAGFTYVNQLLFYSRDDARDDDGEVVASGRNQVLMDMNTFVWASRGPILGGARFSASVTLPIARNSLTSDLRGPVSEGSGFADSYYVPAILGWLWPRASVRAMYGFLAPTGRFAAGGSDNVGSGYWTHTISSGQTFYLTENRRLALSAFEMYEFHTEQEATGVHPGDTFDLDVSLMAALSDSARTPLHFGVVGYFARQTTAKTGPEVSAAESDERYAVNGVGPAAIVAFSAPRLTAALRYFWEFSNRSTYQGSSAQLSLSLPL